MSSGSPRISESTMLNTVAGAQSWAKRPPLTAERRLRTVFISTMSAPHWSICLVSRSSASGAMSGFSNSALPPPLSRKSTLSSFVSPLTAAMASPVAAKLF